MIAATELIAIVSTVDPTTSASAVLTGDQVDMSKWHEAMFILAVGSAGATASVQMDIYGSITSGAASAIVTGKSISTLADGAGSGLQAIIRVTADELASGGYRYLVPYVTVGATAGTRLTMIGLGVYPRYSAASDFDASSVTEIIT